MKGGISLLYMLSDIHGYDAEFSRWLDQLGISDTFKEQGNQLILLGDYIDYGPDSCKVLERIYALSKTMGDALVVLRGNHEEAFLEWLDLYGGPNAGKPDKYGFVDWNSWLHEDAASGYQTFKTFLTREQWDRFRSMDIDLSEAAGNIEAARMLLSHHGNLMKWLRKLPYYYETEKQIFVHAGIDEEYPSLWKELTEPYVFVGKFPAAAGPFCKDIIAGHVAASSAAGNQEYRGVYFDGQSHYYIDGAVQRMGALLCLAYDEQTGKYYELLREDASSSASEKARQTDNDKNVF